MYTPLNATVFPDSYAFGIEPILKAALYFDALYADSFSFNLKEVPPEEDDSEFGSFRLDIVPVNFESDLLQDLVAAGLLLKTPPLMAFEFSSRELPVRVREKIANSLGVGSSFPSHQLASLSRVPHERDSILIKDPADLTDTAVEWLSFYK